MNQEFFNDIFTTTTINQQSSYGLNLSSKLNLDDILAPDYVFTEIFEKNKLSYIVNNYNEKYAIVSDSRDNIHTGCTLEKYVLSSKTKKGDTYIEVKYTQDKNFCTRYQAVHSQSMQAMIREFKQVICHQFYYDIDMKNAHPAMIVWLCRHLNLDCDIVNDYIENREQHFNDLIELNPGYTKSDFKSLFLRSQYGCGIKSFNYFDLNYKNKINHTAFVKSYYEFFKSFSKKVCDLFPELYEMNKVHRGDKKYNYEGSCLSQLMLYIENKCLMKMVKHLNDNDKYKHFIKNLVLCFDGFMIRKNVFYRKQIDLDYEMLVLELNKMFKTIGIDTVQVDLKEMLDHPELMQSYDSNKVYTVKKSKTSTKTNPSVFKSLNYNERKDILLNMILEEVQTMNNHCIRDDNGIDFYNISMHFESFTISEITKLILQTVARIDNAGDDIYMVKTYLEKIFIKDKDDDNHAVEEVVKSLSYQMRDYKKFKSIMISISYQDIDTHISLLNILYVLQKHISYKTVVMEPYGVFGVDKAYDRKCFNIFPGLIHKYDESFIVDESIVSVWTDHIKNVVCNNDEDIYQYMLKYFKHILINPMVKSGTVILVKGKQGSGKNIAFDIFYRYVLGHSLSLVTNRMDDITGRFNSIRESLICCVLDEAVDNQDKKAMNAFKNLITSDSVIIERKGKDAFSLRDFANYVVISNNNFASFIEESDRRSLCLETNDEKIGNTDYFDTYASTLNNIEAGKHIFHWLINTVNIPNKWHPQTFPNTKYKQELKCIMSNSVIKYLLHKYECVKDLEEDFEFRDTSSNLYESYKEFCDKNKFKILNKMAFSTSMKTHWIEEVVQNKRYKIFSKTSLTKSLSYYL